MQMIFPEDVNRNQCGTEHETEADSASEWIN
jgi:hypothetical protein